MSVRLRHIALCIVVALSATAVRAQSDIKSDVYVLDPSKAFKAQLVATSALTSDVTITMPSLSGTMLLTGTAGTQGGMDRSTYLFNVQYTAGTGNATGALLVSSTPTTDASATGLDITATGDGAGTATALKLTASGTTSNNVALEIAGGNIKISTTLPTAVSSTQPLVLEGGVIKIGAGSGHTGSGTANTIAMWTGATALGNSMVSQNVAGTVFTVGGREAITATSNQLVLGSTNTTTINATAPAASLTYTIPDVGADASFVMTEGAQTVNGALTLSGATSLTNTTTAKTGNAIRFENPLGTFSSGFQAGAQTADITYTLPTTAPTANQLLRANATTPTDLEWATVNQLLNGTTANSTLYWNGSAWVENVNVLAPATGNVSVNTVTARAVTNQLVLGTTNTTTITSPAPAASRVYTIPTLSADASFVMTEGAQTINGIKTFGSAPNLSSLTASLPLKLDASKNVTAAAIDLTSATEVTGALPINRGGTNSATALNNDRIMVSNGGAIVEAASLTNGQLLIGSTGAAPVAAALTAGSGITITPAAGSITLAVTNPVPAGTTTDATLRWSGTAWVENTNLLASAAGVLTAQATSNQLVLGTTNTATINASAPAASRVYTIADPGANASFVMTAGAQTIAGVKTFSSGIPITATSNQLVLSTSTSTITLTAPTSAAARVYTIPDAGGAASFVMTASNQTIAGVKTFSSGVAITPTTNQLVLGTTRTVTINAVQPATASRTYTMPDAGSNASFVMTESAQTINGVKTFSSGIPVTATSNQLVLGTTNTATISATAPAASRTYTISDPGANASFVMTEGAQTINGVKTFGSAPNLSSLTASLPLKLDASKNITAAAIDLTSSTEVTGSLPVNRGGTNSVTALNSNRIMVSSGGAIVEAAALTSGQLLIGSVGAAPVAAALTAGSGITITNGAGSITIAASNPMPTGTTNNATLRYDLGTTAWVENTSVTATTSGAVGAASLTLSNTSNQLVLGGLNTTTISATAPGASRTYTIGDPGANASFVMTEGAQTINGVKTFGSEPNLASLTASGVLALDASKNITSTVLTNGQILIGSTGSVPVAAALTAGTGITVTNGAGTISLAVTNPLPSGTTTNATMRYNGTNWVENTGVLSNGTSLTIPTTTNQLVLGTTRTVTVSAVTPATASRTYTMPDAGADASFVMTESAQTINGAKTLTGTTVIGSTAGATVTLANATGSLTVNGTALTPNVTITSLGGTARVTLPSGYDRIVLANSSGSLDEASIATVIGSSVWSLTGNATASAWNGTTGSYVGTSSTQPLVLATTNATAQDIRFFTGVSGASERMRINSTGEVGIGTTSASGQLLTVNGTAGTPNVTITNLGGTAKATTPVGYDRVILGNSTGSLDEVALSTIVQTSGAQTIAGTKTFSSAIAITPTTNQLVLGTTNTVTINSPATAANRVYSLPVLTADASFVMTEGTQTINGNKTLSGTTNLSALTASLPLKLDASKNITAAGIDLSSATEVLNTLPVNRGGTSFSTYATGDILYASAANTLSKLPIGTNGQFLTIASGVPAWASGSIMQYDVLTAQSSSTNGSNFLFNVQYGTIAGAAAGARIASVATVLGSSATGLAITATGAGTSTATALTLAATGSTTKYALTVADGSGFSGFGTTAPTHVVHSVYTGTNDEVAAVLGNASTSTSIQAIGVWGDASSSGASATGTIGVLATGSGNATAAQTNIALQVADGNFTMGRTAETGTGYTVVEAATAGTAYSADGPSGVIEINLGTVGGWADNGNISTDRVKTTTVTINNRYITTSSIVLLTVIDKVDVVVNNTVNTTQSIFTLDVDDRAAGSCLVQIAAQLRNGAANNNNPFSDGDKIKIGYMIVNPSK